jgi:hypothetical protein
VMPALRAREIKARTRTNFIVGLITCE